MDRWIATRRGANGRPLYWSHINGRWCWLPHRHHAVLYPTATAATARAADYNGHALHVTTHPPQPRHTRKKKAVQNIH